MAERRTFEACIDGDEGFDTEPFHLSSEHVDWVRSTEDELCRTTEKGIKLKSVRPSTAQPQQAPQQASQQAQQQERAWPEHRCHHGSSLN